MLSIKRGKIADGAKGEKMKWNKFTIETTTQAEDFVSAMLNDLGIEGIEIEDNIPLTEEEQKGMFIDFPPELPEDDGTSRVSFYLEEQEDAKEILRKVMLGLEEQRQFVDVGAGTISSSQTEDIDWINNWKKFFQSFYIDDILIKPTWETLKEEDKDKFLIEIDPGVSFGTGKHETTQLCIRQLRKYLKAGDRVLDVGCGSGILSIVAMKLGASHVVGTDLDENCMTSTYENMEVNHLPKEMAPVIPARLKKGGVFITSGIIDFKENEVKEAIEKAGLTVLEINHQGEWVNITAQKN